MQCRLNSHATIVGSKPVNSQVPFYNIWQHHAACSPVKQAAAIPLLPCSKQLFFSRHTCSAASWACLVPAAPVDGWPLLALLLSSASFSIYADARSRIGAALSAPLIAMACGIVLSSAGIIPSDCIMYEVVWQYMMPMGAACFLLESDFSSIGGTGATLSIAFLIGALGMVIGACAGYILLKGSLGIDKELACCLCASYIGGSVNFAAVAKAVGLSASKIPAAMAVDNLAMAACLALLLGGTSRGAASESPPGAAGGSLPASGQNAHSGGDGADVPCRGASTDGRNSGSHELHPPCPSVQSISLALAAAGMSCTIGAAMAGAVGQPNLGIACMSIVALGFALAGKQILGRQSLQQTQALKPPQQFKGSSLTSHQQRHQQLHVRKGTEPRAGATLLSPFSGAAHIGGSIMAIFFTVIGASAGSLSAIAKPETPAILVFILVMVCMHWLFLWVASKTVCRKLPLSALLLGSNACIGGPATAAGMAASKGWQGMVQPAMMCGSLGYAVGTTAGLLVARLIGVIH